MLRVLHLAIRVCSGAFTAALVQDHAQSCYLIGAQHMSAYLLDLTDNVLQITNETVISKQSVQFLI